MALTADAVRDDVTDLADGVVVAPRVDGFVYPSQRDHALRQPMTVRCVCGWSLEAVASEALGKSAAHRSDCETVPKAKARGPRRMSQIDLCGNPEKQRESARRGGQRTAENAAAEKAARDAVRPSCSCHDRPMYWQRDTKKTEGGYYRCAVRRADKRRIKEPEVA